MEHRKFAMVSERREEPEALKEFPENPRQSTGFKWQPVQTSGSPPGHHIDHLLALHALQMFARISNSGPSLHNSGSFSPSIHLKKYRESRNEDTRARNQTPTPLLHADPLGSPFKLGRQSVPPETDRSIPRGKERQLIPHVDATL